MYELRPYQKDAVALAVDFFKNKKKRGAVEVLPTGSGKSLIIAAIAKELKQPVLVFQPSKEILVQNYNKYLSYGQKASIFSASLNSKEISDVTFATIGSVKSKPDFFKGFSNVIVDECHFVNAKQGMYKDFFNVVGDKILGLTATPYRLTTDGFGGSILKFITRTRPRVFEELIYYVQNELLFSSGYLAKLTYYQVGGFDSKKLTINSTGADYTDKSVINYYREINFSKILRNSVNRCIEIGRKNILVFTRFVSEALALEKEFPESCKVVSAETPPKDRDKIISDFKSGKIKIVANVGILTTGFDFPELETIIVARPTRSLGLYYQMIGRGIRLHPEKEVTFIIDLCENYKRFGEIENLRIEKTSKDLWYVTNGKKQLTNIYYD